VNLGLLNTSHCVFINICDKIRFITTTMINHNVQYSCLYVVIFCLGNVGLTVILRGVRVTIIAVENNEYYIFCLCMCVCVCVCVCARLCL
jgi:hypothetical protein